MTLRHMKIFTAVFQCGNITKAAGKLHLAQPSVSLAVKELEEYYGVRLFERIGRGISPTEAGREYYGYALHIVSLFDEMEKKMKNWDAFGTIRIGSSVTIGTCLLPTLIRRFREQRPDLSVEAQVNSSGVIEQSVLDNVIDIGLIENQPEHPELCSVVFMEDELWAVAAPGHELAEQSRNKAATLEDLARCPLLMREKGSAGREILDACFEVRQMSVRPVLESSSTQAIVSAAAEGLGVAVLPCLLVKKDIAEGRVVRIPLERPLLRNLNLIYHKSKYLTESMKLFMQLCLEAGKQESGRNKEDER